MRNVVAKFRMNEGAVSGADAKFFDKPKQVSRLKKRLWLPRSMKKSDEK